MIPEHIDFYYICCTYFHPLLTRWFSGALHSSANIMDLYILHANTFSQIAFKHMHIYFCKFAQLPTYIYQHKKLNPITEVYVRVSMAPRVLLTIELLFPLVTSSKIAIHTSQIRAIAINKVANVI